MDLQMDKLGLSLEQTEILYNLEYYKTLNDIETTNIPIVGKAVKELKLRGYRNGISSFLMDLKVLRKFQVPKCIGTLWTSCTIGFQNIIPMNRGID